MKTWDEYKDHVKATDLEGGKIIEETEDLAAIVGIIVQRRNARGISQRQLAAMCGMSQSSIARIESLQTEPRVSTLLKIMRPLGLTLVVRPTRRTVAARTCKLAAAGSQRRIRGLSRQKSAS